MRNDDDAILQNQIGYYRARANEYDQWFLRQGRYDRGPEHRGEWLGEVELVRRSLSAAIADADVLELACGTGLWTEQLARENRRVYALDASPETLGWRGTVQSTGKFFLFGSVSP